MSRFGGVGARWWRRGVRLGGKGVWDREERVLVVGDVVLEGGRWNVLKLDSEWWLYWTEVTLVLHSGHVGFCWSQLIKHMKSNNEWLQGIAKACSVMVERHMTQS